MFNGIIMKKIFFILIFTLAPGVFCHSGQIKNFDELMNALKSGKNVKVVIHYANCRLMVEGKEEKSPDVIGGMDLKAFEYFAKGTVRNEKAFIASSETILISHPAYGYVNNYIKLRIYDDNTVEIIARYLDPKTFEVKMDEAFYSTVNNGNGKGAVFFYQD